MIARLEEAIAGSDQLSRDKRAELRGVISTRPGMNRYLRVTPGGLLRTDAAKAKAEENLDGKYLLRTADPKVSAEDIALGYKQLLEVERGWRGMKQVIDLRPVYHRREDRIRAHITLCWLALLLARIAENACKHTWPSCAASSTASTSAPSPGSPTPSSSAPSSPNGSATSSKPCKSRPSHASTSWNSPTEPDPTRPAP
jgi:hypothetical protein